MPDENILLKLSADTSELELGLANAKLAVLVFMLHQLVTDTAKLAATEADTNGILLTLKSVMDNEDFGILSELAKAIVESWADENLEYCIFCRESQDSFLLEIEEEEGKHHETCIVPKAIEIMDKLGGSSEL